MEGRISEQAYENMINALYQFAGRTYVIQSEMTTLASVCEQAIGGEDETVEATYERVKECNLKLEDLTDSAKRIAELMQEELDRIRQERAIMNGDSVE